MVEFAHEDEQNMWTYEQFTGRILQNDRLVGVGYAGSPQGKDNPDMQDVAQTGPLPRGLYTIEAPQNSPHTGPFTLDLTPDPGNKMFGRSEFRIHGDSIEHPGTASEGCIIMARSIREQIWTSGDHELHVVRGGDSGVLQA
jgi:hypothetical protein